MQRMRRESSGVSEQCGLPARGFTLVELLVVIAVVAVLVGILVPAVGGGWRSARAVQCLSNCREVGRANQLFAKDHRGCLCPHSVWNRSMESASGRRGVNQEWSFADPVRGDPKGAHVNGLLGPYLGENPEVLMCPEYETPADVLALTRRRGLAYPQLVHYGYNGLMLGEKHPNFNTLDESKEGYRTWMGYRISTVASPTETVMFADTAQRLVGRLLPQKDVLPSLDEWFADGSPRAFASPTVHGRHAGRASVVWVDGHATHERVRVYEDQSGEDHEDSLGYLAPMSSEIRDNSWMRAR